MPRLGRIAQLAILTLLATFACTSVRTGDLAGQWNLMDASRRYLPADIRTAPVGVTLDGDGKFSAVELPQFKVDASSVRITAKSGNGTWRLINLSGEDVLQLSFADGSGHQLKIATSLGSQMTLYYFLGDPDSGQRVEFVRGR